MGFIRPQAGKIWVFVFLLWGALLSGAFNDVVGSPGAVQAFRLNGLLKSRQEQVQKLELVIIDLDNERSRLEKSASAQEREIRRVLGYAAADELVFDFSSAR